jgi:hypothetical protein
MDKKLKIGLVVAVIIVIIVVIIVVVVVEAHKKSGGSSSGGNPSGSSSSGGHSSGGHSSGGHSSGSSSVWDAIKKAWPKSRGSVLNMVIGTNAGKASDAWVTDNAPNVGMTMTQASANTVCNKACDGWKKVPQVSKYCDCSTDKATDKATYKAINF